MAKRSALSRATELALTALKLIIALIICAIASAALIYSYNTVPFFLWAVLFGGGYIAIIYSGIALFAAIFEQRWLLPAVVIFWIVVGVYVDLMRYLSLVWEVKLDGSTQSTIDFPRYFVFHVGRFFQDLWTTVTGAPTGTTIVVLPDPVPVIPKNSGPWFVISQYAYNFSQNVFVNIFSSFLFAFIVLLWNSRRNR